MGDFFGETKGNLVKPGMTAEDLAALEKKTLRTDEPDPLADFMNDKSSGTASPPKPNPWRRMPLPSQDEIFGRPGAQSAAPAMQQPPSFAAAPAQMPPQAAQFAPPGMQAPQMQPPQMQPPQMP